MPFFIPSNHFSTNKARTGLWFTEKLQVAKKDGRIIPLAPTSALRASIIRKKRGNLALFLNSEISISILFNDRLTTYGRAKVAV